MPRRRSMGWWPLAVVLGCVAAIQLRDHGPGGEAIPWLASGIVLTALAPAWVRARSRGRGAGTTGPIPFMALIGVVHAVYYGLPALLSDRVVGIGHEVDTDGLLRALGLAWLGVAALVAGYHLLGPRVPLGRPLDLAWDPARARSLALVLLPVGLAAQVSIRLLEVSPLVARPLGLIGAFFPVAIGALMLLGRRGHVSRGLAGTAWFVLVPVYLLLEAGDGFVGSAVKAAVFVAMLHWGVGRRIPLLALVVGAVLLATLRAGGHEYRRLTGQAGGASGGLVERAETVVGLSLDAFQERGAAELTGSLVERVAQIVVLGVVAERTPGAVPYWGGRTFLTLPGAFVPRALWPSKPRKNVGQDFGHRYGFLDPDDRQTSVNLPQLIEWYANFGRLGLVGGLLLVGVCYRRLEHVLNHHGASDANVLVAAALLSPLVNIESDTSLVFGEMLQLAVVLLVVLRTVRVQRPLPRPAPRPLRPLTGSSA